MRRASLLLLMALGACAADQGPPRPGGARLVPDEEGLAVEGTSQRIDFGRAPAGVKVALTRETGQRPEVLPLSGCPPGVAERLRWGDLTLTFTRERFVGWQSKGASAGTVCP